MSSGTDPNVLIAPLRHWATVAEQRPFLTIVDLPGRSVELSYGEFYERVRRLAAALHSRGLRPGDRCIVHTGNSLGFMVSFWALQELGAVAVPTIAQYSPDELHYVAEHCQAWGAIATPTLLEVARTALDATATMLIVDDLWDPCPNGEKTRLSDLIAESTHAHIRDHASPDGAALILYTSGTTARPKGVMLSHRSAVYTATSYAQHLRLQPRDTVLTCMPLFHVNGMFLQMIPAVLSGTRLVLTPRFSASQYWTWVDEHEVTVTHLIAGPIRLLMAGDTAPPTDHQVRTMTFGLPLSDDEIATFEARFAIPLTMVWGLTETCCGATMMPLDFGRKPGHQQIGPAMLGWEVRVARPGGTDEVADGEVGELLVRSPGVMSGYYRDPESTRQTLEHGWVHTGDLGSRDSHGHFHFIARIKDMLKPSGENVAASEIEDTILTHPTVAECAVIGIADPIRTETIVAIVVPAPGATISPEEIRALCRERLASFKVPSVIEVREHLPKTSIGKIRKGELRSELSTRVASPDTDLSSSRR